MILPVEPADHLRIVAVVQIEKAVPPEQVVSSMATIVRRLRRSQFVEAIAISMPRHDDNLALSARENHVLLVREPENDTLARIARVAELLDADIIVHIVPQHGAVDPGLVDHLVTTLLEQDCDFVRHETAAADSIVEPFTRRALDKLMMDAHDDVVARDRVTGYFRLHPAFVRTGHAGHYPAAASKVRSEAADSVSPQARGIDTQSESLRISEGVSSPKIARSSRQANREPKGRRKEADYRALILCNGNVSRGDHDIARMLAFAAALRDAQRTEPIFCFAKSEQVPDFLRGSGFEAHCLQANSEQAIKRIMDVRRVDILVCVGHGGLSQSALNSLRDRVALVAVVDDFSDARLSADLAYYVPLPRVEQLDWSASRCVARAGWQWAIVDGGLATSRASLRSLPRPTLIVALDGKDASARMVELAKALSTYPQGFRARFVIPPEVENRAYLARAIVASAANFETVEGASSLSGELDICDLALVSFGPVACTLAARGVPALYLCENTEEAQAGIAFERAGMGISLGIVEDVEEQNIADAVWALLKDSVRRRQMSAAGIATIDGEGASRVAADIVRTLVERSSAATRPTAQSAAATYRPLRTPVASSSRAL